MHEEKLNEAIRTAVDHAVPDVLPSVLADCRNQKGNVIVMKEYRRTSRNRIRMLAATAACLALLLGGGALWGYQVNYSVDSTISLDVNPSIEITLNQKEKVLAVTPLNPEGQTVVGNMDFRGSSLDLTVNALIGSMVRNGYLNELCSSDGKHRLISKYRTLSCVIGEEITFMREGVLHNARAIGIDEDGALIIQYDNSTREALNSGEISIRVGQS